jgi:hypothetical protein
MEWVLKLPSNVLVDLLDKPVDELNAVEKAVRETINGIYDDNEIQKMRSAADLDSKLPMKPITVGVVKKTKI